LKKLARSLLADLTQERVARREVEKQTAPKVEAALAKFDAAKDDKERAAAAKELLLAKSRYLAGRLTEIAIGGTMNREERREQIGMIHSMAAADAAVYSMQRTALGLDRAEPEQDSTATRDLEQVLRDMEGAGEISPPKVSVNDAAQREPDGLAGSVQPKGP
jgi:hypothetical protein